MEQNLMNSEENEEKHYKIEPSATAKSNTSPKPQKLLLNFSDDDDEISNENKRVKPPPTPPMSPKTFKRTKLSKDELDQIINGLIYGAPISTVQPGELPAVITALQEYKAQKILEMKTTEAERAEKIAYQAEKLYEKYLKIGAQKEQEQSVITKLEIAKAKLRAFDAEYEENVRNIKQEFAEQQKKLEEKHKKEEEDLEDEWNSDKQIRRFNRASQQIRQLKTQAIKLLNSQRYDEMRYVEEKAKHLQKQETIEKSQAYFREYQHQKQILKQNQKNDIDVLDRAQTNRIQSYTALYQKERKAYVQRIENLKNELEESKNADKVWNLHYRNEKMAFIPRQLIPKPTYEVIQPMKLPKLQGTMIRYRTSSVPSSPRQSAPHSPRVTAPGSPRYTAPSSPRHSKRNMRNSYDQMSVDI